MSDAHVLRKLIPSALATWGVAFFSLAVIVAGNAHDLLARYGLISSTTIVHNQLKHGVSGGLVKLDSFTFTDTVVNFMLWGVVGLVSFSVFQSILRASKYIKYEEEVGSNEYVHPASFKRDNYWSSILLDALFSFLLLALFVGGAILYVLKVYPYGIRHTGLLLLDTRLAHIKDFVLGALAIFVSSYVLFIVLQLVIRHHQASEIEEL